MKLFSFRFLPGHRAFLGGVWACFALFQSTAVEAQTVPPTPVPTKIETPLKTLKRATFDFWAIPSTPYSIIKNTPGDKEYLAYAIMKSGLSMDPHDASISATPFFAGVSDFSVVAQFDGNNLVPNQKYIWRAPNYYIPIIPPPSGVNNPSIRVSRDIANAVDETIIQTSPGWQYLHSKWNLSPSSLVIPGWWEDLLQQRDLSANYANPPTSWRADVSETDKTFHWNFGSGLDTLPRETTTQVVVEGDDRAVAQGNVKIKWVRPPQLIYDVDFSTGEWLRNGDTLTYDDWTMFFGSAAFNQKLMDQLKLEGCIGAVATPVVVGIGAGAKVILRITLAKAASSPFIARMGNNALSKVISREATERGWTNFGRNAQVRSIERGLDNSPIDAAVDRRIAGPGASADEATPTTTRQPGGCFAAGTLVVMADGSMKAIEQVKAGDEVLSRDAFTGQTAGKKVKNLTVREVGDTLRLWFSDGSQIEATANHPFFGFVSGSKAPMLSLTQAGHLGIGTSIITRAGPAYGWNTLSLVNAKHQNRRTRVYNFEVEGFHTYFVGKNALWVHNQNPEDCPTLEPDEGEVVSDPLSVAPHSTLIPNLEPLKASTSKLWRSLPRSKRRSDSTVSGAHLETHTPGGNVVIDAGFNPAVSGRDIELKRAPDGTILKDANDEAIPDLNPDGSFKYPPLHGRELTPLDVTNGTGRLQQYSHPIGPDEAGHKGTRAWDSEIKLMEELQAKADLDESLTGTFTIYSSRVSCSSCQDVARWWNTQSPYKDRLQVRLYWDGGQGP
jgi:hypothetical protein